MRWESEGTKGSTSLGQKPLSRAGDEPRGNLRSYASSEVRQKSRRIHAKEFQRHLNGVDIDSSELFNDKLQEWRTCDRRTGPSATHHERLRQKTLSSK